MNKNGDDKAKRVLVFAEYGWRNGGENSLLAIVQAMPVDKFCFVVACPAGTELADYLHNIEIEHHDWKVIGDEGRKSQPAIREEIAKLIVGLKPDLVHCNSLSTSRLVGPVTEELKLPAVGFLRDIVKLSKQAIDDINQLSAIVAVSQATADFHEGQGVNGDKLQVIHNGVDLQKFQPGSRSGYLHRELSIPTEVRLICCVGQIGLRKGTDVVIRSFLELSKRFDDLTLVLIGIRNSAKDEAIEFESRCRKLGSRSEHHRVYWLDRRADVPQILNECVLLLHGARQEPLGRVLLEALACGCPFVATDVGGTREIIQGTDGISVVCPVDSVDGMVDCAATILASPSLQNEVAGQFRGIAKQRFGIEDCIEKLSRLYVDILPPNSCVRQSS